MKLTKITASESGASAVELAIILPILILLIFGIVQFGIAWNRTQGLHAAAREGARVASVGADYDTIVERVHASQSLFKPEDLDISVYNLADGAGDWVESGSQPCIAKSLVEVRVRVEPEVAPDYGVKVPLFGEFTINYGSSGQFRCEQVSG